MTCVLLMILSVGAADSIAAEYAIPFEDNYSYIVTVTDSRPTAIFIADTSGDTIRKIPQTVRFERGSFSIVCDLRLRRGSSTVYALVSPKGTITVTKAGLPRIDSKTGKLLPEKRK